MKKVLVSLIAILIIAGCSKSGGSNVGNNSAYTGSYVDNGVNYHLNSNRVYLDYNSSGLYGVMFELYYLTQPSSGPNGIGFAILPPNDTLIIGKQYTTPYNNSTFAKDWNAFTYVSDTITFNVTITRNSNGTIDGTFNGKVNAILFPSNAILNDSIYNGVFTNAIITRRYH